ncbi:redoxin domain-containing protein [Streptomyces sp. TRM66268-LWL]|uniref:Redoxin domain-containing protein n=1 Tax=Streptomyces polyasparticus TaxID=2767826 RepID=A0ABR7S9C8_9ACTN|nr:redoxin domain-containing protein [Streptomyces polyasparticus]MBC9710998.1 redoxin domain-containing protein [Streptomyces polyasparticus]
MPYVITGLVLVAAVAALNTVLLVVILRRWQELEAVRRRDGFAGQGPQPGDRLPEFTSTAVSGRTLSESDLRSGELLLGVFSHDCPSCTDSLPDFAEQAGRARAAGGRAVALVMGEEAGDSALTGQLDGIADEIVVHPEAAPLFRALQVPAFPTILRYRDGVVTAPFAADREPVPAAS